MSSQYPHSKYIVSDFAIIAETVRRFPLATFVTGQGEDLQFSQIPVVWEQTGHESAPTDTLVGHIDRNNPQTALLFEGPVQLLFYGPQGYISPLEYATKQLPTWNFITVKLQGVFEKVEEKAAAKKAMLHLINTMEADHKNWVLSPEDPRLDYLIDYVETFRISITKWEGRVKMSQEKTEADYKGALSALNQQNPNHERFSKWVLNKQLKSI